jgi:hypothetical protein
MKIRRPEHTLEGAQPFAPKPVPAKPTHCRSCGLLLEAMRRYAGLCKRCVADWPRLCVLAPPAAADPPLQMRIVRRFKRRTARWVELECGCGARRLMQEANYEAQRPQSCKACRLRALKKRGFEAEYARWKPR